MIEGCKYYDSYNISFYNQENNAVETILKKSGIKGWRESCAYESACSIMSAMSGKETKIKTPGGGFIQGADAAVIWVNDPGNFKYLTEARSDIRPGDYLNNEIPQYTPVTMKHVFNVDCFYKAGLSWENIIDHLRHGEGVQLFLTAGHYVAAVAYDNIKNEIIYNDSWPGRRGLKNRGFNERLTYSQYKSDFTPYGVIFLGK